MKEQIKIIDIKYKHSNALRDKFIENKYIIKEK